MSGEVDVVLVAGARTPFGKFGGALRHLSIPELGALAAREVLRRSGVGPDAVDELVLGVNLPGSDRSLARQVLLQAGMSDDKVAYTVDRACCSSLTAASLASRAIRLGEASTCLAGGAENLSRVPFFLEDLRWGHPLGAVTLVDQLVISCPYTHVPRAVQAGEEALRFGVERAEQDDWAVRSQHRYQEALAAGRFADELFPIELSPDLDQPDQLVADESPRPGTTRERLARLPTVYGSPTVTAGNAPGLSTGGSCVLLSSGDAARQRQLQPLATVIGTAMTSGPPANIASAPAAAAALVLRRCGLTIDQVDLIEVNEAFAAVPLVTTLVLADGDRNRAAALRDKTNVNGGAIAIGHPTGATGTRLLTTLAYELRRRGGGIGLVTICGGIGEAEAVLLRVDA